MASPLDSQTNAYQATQFASTGALAGAQSQSVTSKVPAKKGDTVERASQTTSTTTQKVNPPDMPSLPPVDASAALASDSNYKKFMKTYVADGGKNIQSYIDKLPPDIQAALYSGASSPALDSLIGKMQTVGLVAALASVGLKNAPSTKSSEPVSFKADNLPKPGPIPATATASTDRNPQLVSNAAQSTMNALKIAGAEAKNLPASGSQTPALMAFLKAIGEAIDRLKQFMATLEKGDLKGSLGQRFDAGSDAASLAEHKIEAAHKKASDGSKGIMGMISHIANDIFGPIFKMIGINPFGGSGGLFGGIQDIAKKLMDIDIPVLSGVLKDIAKAFGGIPILGDILNMVAQHPALLLAALAIAAVVFVVATVLCCGAAFWAPFIGLAAAAIALAIVVILGMMVTGEPLPIVGNLLSMTNTQLPIIGGILSMVTGFLDQIPILGDIMKTFGLDNQWVLLALAVVIVAAVVICCCCVWAIPFVLLLIIPALIATDLAVCALTGTDTHIPIVSDLIGRGPTSEAYPKSAKPKAKSAGGTASGSTATVNNAAGMGVKAAAKDNGVPDDVAEILAQVQKLIGLLVALQTAAQGGTIGPIPMDQILGIINKLSQEGVGGTAMDDAKKAGNAGNADEMFAAISRAFESSGVNPTATANFLKQSLQTVGTSAPVTMNHMPIAA